MRVTLLDGIVSEPLDVKQARFYPTFSMFVRIPIYSGSAARSPYVSESGIRENSSDNHFEILLMKRLFQHKCVGISRLQRSRPIAGHENKRDLTRFEDVSHRVGQFPTKIEVDQRQIEGSGSSR
jgi:hypothetical protein